MRAREIPRQSPAGFVSRLIAFVADVVLVTVTTQAAVWLIASMETLFRSVANVDLVVAVASVLPVVATVYYVGFWAATGQTPGKWLLGLRVVAKSGGRLPFGRAVLRLVGYVVSALPLYAGFLWVLVDSRRRAWHDRLAGSRVIYDPSWVARKPLTWQPGRPPVGSDEVAGRG